VDTVRTHPDSVERNSGRLSLVSGSIAEGRANMPKTKAVASQDSGSRRPREEPAAARGAARSVQGWISVADRKALGHILADHAPLKVGAFVTAAVVYWIKRGEWPPEED
jgi:hypothetical protein